MSIVCVPLAVLGVLETGFGLGLIGARIALGIRESEPLFFGDPAGPLWVDVFALGVCLAIAAGSIGLRRFAQRALQVPRAGA